MRCSNSRPLFVAILLVLVFIPGKEASQWRGARSCPAASGGGISVPTLDEPDDDLDTDDDDDDAG
jgi:hypothetical protein